MVVRPDRVCVPLEIEMVSLHREHRPPRQHRHRRDRSHRVRRLLSRVAGWRPGRESP